MGLVCRHCGNRDTFKFVVTSEGVALCDGNDEVTDLPEFRGWDTDHDLEDLVCANCDNIDIYEEEERSLVDEGKHLKVGNEVRN